MSRSLSIEQVFHTAREMGSPVERAAYLQGACGHDAGMRSKVEALLKADAEAGSFMAGDSREAGTGDSPGPSGADSKATVRQDSNVQTQSLTEGPGTVIGRYKLLQQIGEGGFGVVYMAEQREPVKRRVALKIIKLGMDTKQVIARFEAERQALAMMDHPNIAKVLDAGATETGRPYFVMELVRGVPIVGYCDTEKLDARSRLDLFIRVCQAIQHAHQKGIIHRDIKPNNVLVTLHDGVPVPKVIDFGIAKATNAELTEKTLFTQHRQFIGTPAYMSPEQAEMSGLDIDTRSDIYSLGVLLYELLTGTTPFDTKQLLAVGLGEIQRIIREQEPHRPSTRISSMAGGAHPVSIPDGLADSMSVEKPPARKTTSAVEIARHRRTDPAALTKLLRGDLDWIIMKALEKDRTRRYETANGFAADVGRFLRDEPVEAGPPSARYRFGKFVRRNRASVLAGTAIAAALLVGVIGTSVGWIWAARARERVVAQSRKAAEALSQVTEEFRSSVDAQAKKTGETGPVVVPIVGSVEGAEVEALAKTAVNLVRSLDASRAAEVEQRQAAERELGRALAAEAEALDQARAAYSANIKAAFMALSHNDRASSARHLDAAPLGMRHWLWEYLSAESQEPLILDSSELWGTSGQFTSLSFDGARIAAVVDKEVVVYDSATRRKHQTIKIDTEHLGQVSRMALSPDGETVAIATGNGRIQLTRVSDGREKGSVTAHRDEIWKLVFSPDGSRLVSSSATKSLLWATDELRQIEILSHEPDSIPAVSREPEYMVDWLQVWSAAFSSCSKTLALGMNQGPIHLYDASDGSLVAKLEGHAEGPSVLAFSTDGERLISIAADRELRVWDVAYRKLVGVEDLGSVVGKATDIFARVEDISSDGRRLLAWRRDGAHRMIDLATLSMMQEFGPRSGWAFFSPDGALVGTHERAVDVPVLLWDVAGATDWNTVEVHTGLIRSVDFSPDGGRIASGGDDGKIRIWDSATRENLCELVADVGEVEAVAFAPTGELLAAAVGREIQIWDPTIGRHLRTMRGHQSLVRTVAFSPDGGRLATGAWDDTVRLWDPATGDPINVLRGHEGHIEAVRFHPEGRRLASASHDGTVRVWSAATGELLHTLRGHEGEVLALAFRPDGDLLASGGGDRTIRVWDMMLAEETAVLEGHESSVEALAFSVDGTDLLSGDFKGAVRCWEGRNAWASWRMAEPAKEIPVQSASHGIASLSMHPDGLQLVGSCWDGRLRFWHASEYAARYWERRAILDATAEAGRIVDRLLEDSDDLRDVVRSVRGDASLAEPVRRAVLNEVLKRGSGHR